MSLANRKKFFDISGYEVVDSSYAITLDKQKISTQGGNPFVVPFEDLALAVSIEWNNQVKIIQPDTMPITSFCYTVLDLVAEKRDLFIDQLVHYAKSDLLCYHAEDPIELQSLQEIYWQPLIDWANDTYDLRLKVTYGILHVKQPQQSISNLRHVIEGLDDFQLTTLAAITKNAGSLIIGLSVICGRTSADDAFDASQLDENWQRNKWGKDTEDMKRSKRLHAELLDAVRFLDLVKSD